MRINNQLSVLLFLIFHFLHAIPVAPQEGPEYSYDESTGRGPSKWAQLRPAWAGCNGKMQTPVSISFGSTRPLPSMGIIDVAYKPAPATAVHTAHGIKIEMNGDAGGLQLGRTFYSLRQFHWHWGTEHAIDGQRNVLELHLVHQAANRTAVIGILYKIGHHDKILTQLIPKMKGLEDGAKAIGTVDPSVIRIDKANYARYTGSFTTPPCTEGVTWTVIKKISEASPSQVEELKKLSPDKFGSTARPLQPLNGRAIYSFHTTF